MTDRSAAPRRSGEDAGPQNPQRWVERLRARAATAAGSISVRLPEILRSILEAAGRRLIPDDAFYRPPALAATYAFSGTGALEASPLRPRKERRVRARRSMPAHDPVDPAIAGRSDPGKKHHHRLPRYRRKRQEAEDALRASAESYRTIFELASDAIFVHDVETGAILDANRKACELHGCTLEALKALGVGGISDGRPPFDAEHARAYIRRAAEGEPQRFEWLVRDQCGNRFWVEVSLHRVRILGDDRVLASVRNITERKQAEAALQRAHDELEQHVAARTAELDERTAELAQAEQRFRAIVEASPTPLLLSSLEDGSVLYANDRLEALLGVAPGSLIGKKTSDYYYDLADRPRILETIQKQGYVRDLELCVKRADGTPRWVSLSTQRLTYDGQPALATALVDITERKEAQEALRASEESYRGLFNNLTELVYVQDLDGHFLNVNEAVVHAYGYSREELIGKTPAFLAAPERVNLAETMAAFRLAVAGEPQRFDWWGRRKDGSYFPKEIVLHRSTYFGQDVVIAVARDISERTQAEAALRRSEAHFRRLIENASDVATILEPNGITRYQSPSIERVLGYRPNELTGTNAFERIHPEDAAFVRKALETAVQHPGSTQVIELRYRHKDGSWRVLEASGRTLLPDSAAAGIIVNSRDVTERVEAERDLHLQKALLEAQGEASIDGILVVSEEGKILSYNHRFIEMWGLSSEVVASKSDAAALRAVLDQLQDPAEFLARVDYLYAHPAEKARDEITLRDGRVLDRYSAPVKSCEGDCYGRIWFFRDVTLEKRHARELEAATREAERAREQANHYAQSLERELEIGRQIQQGFLPARLPQPSGWQIAARFRPAWQVAGDFYDVFALPSGRVGLVIADVCGKGVGAALFMALFQSLLRAYAERADGRALGVATSDEAILTQAITATNGYITRVHKPAHMFASVFFGLLDPATGVLHYVNAGHEPPILVGPDGPERRLAPTGPALGLLAQATFTVAETALMPGEGLLAYTDGVTEARNAERAFFTEERLLSLLTPARYTAPALLDRVEEAVCEFTGEAAASDDLTLLALCRNTD